jgi:hypothetical protein
MSDAVAPTAGSLPKAIRAGPPLITSNAVLDWNGARGPGSPLARSRGRKLGTRGRKASQQQLVNAGKASAARADEFARDVRLLIGGALKATHGNYTQAAAQLNEDGYRSAEGKLWGRRSVAAVVRRLQRLKLWP